MRLARLSRLAAILTVAAIEISCGDTFRQIAIPQNPNPPDPESLHFALVVTDDGTENPGGSSRIDVSGDTNVGTARTGIGPVHAAMLPSGSQAYVANKTEDTISSYLTSNAAQVSTITLPAGSAPAFVHTTQSDTVYVANSGNATVSVINTTRNAVTQTIGVGTNPIGLAETPDGKKLYVVNQGSNSVTAINVIDKTVNATITDAAIDNPIMAIARSDSARVYVLNQGSETISVLDTATDAVIGLPVTVGAANFMYYEKNLNRLYLTVPGANQLVVLDVSADPPKRLSVVDLTTSCPAPACVLDSVTALPNKLRAYVSSYQVSGTCAHVDGIPDLTGSCITTFATVVKVPENTVLRTLTLPHKVVVNTQILGNRPDVKVVDACDSAPFRRYIASAVDSTRVYVANCDGGTTDIVRTSDDTFVLGLPAPFSQAPPTTGSDSPPPQNPVFVVPGPR